MLEIENSELYIIRDHVRELEGVGTLKIYRPNEGKGGVIPGWWYNTHNPIKELPVVFLNISDFNFPLQEHVQTLKVSDYYVVLPFPDGTFYGIELPKATADADVMKFQEMLERYSNVQKLSELHEQGRRSVQVLLRVADVELYELSNGIKRHSFTGELVVLKALTEDAMSAIAFLSLGDFNFPLQKHIPTLQIMDHFFVFRLDEHIYYGIKLPEATAVQDLQIFKALLQTHAMLNVTGLESNQNRDTGIPDRQARDGLVATGLQKVASGIEKAGEKVQNGIIYSAEKTGNGIKKGGDIVKKRTKEAEEEKELSPNMTVGVLGMKFASSMASNVSDKVVRTVENTSETIGEKLATIVTKPLPASIKNGNALGPATQAGCDVILKSFDTLEMIWNALGQAAQILFADFKGTAYDVIEHKYGRKVATTAVDVMESGKNIGTAMLGLNVMQPDRLVGTIVKETFKSSVEEIRPDSLSHRDVNRLLSEVDKNDLFYDDEYDDIDNERQARSL